MELGIYLRFLLAYINNLSTVTGIIVNLLKRTNVYTHDIKVGAIPVYFLHHQFNMLNEKSVDIQDKLHNIHFQDVCQNATYQLITQAYMCAIIYKCYLINHR